MSDTDTSAKCMKIATDLAELVKELNEQGIQLDSHDSFYLGYASGSLVKIAKTLKESAAK